MHKLYLIVEFDKNDCSANAIATPEKASPNPAHADNAKCCHLR